MKISERQRERAIKAKASADKRRAFAAHKKWMDLDQLRGQNLENELKNQRPTIWARLAGKIKSSL